MRAHLQSVWRFLRRLGFSPEDADDATQEIFVIAVAKLDQILPDRDKAFLFGIAVRFASRHRRSQGLRAAKASAIDVDAVSSADPQSDELLERRDAREFLDRTLASMTPDLRATFALYELEEMTMIEIAEVTEVPLGTVASRLRRAREQFQEAVRRYQLARAR